MKKIVSLLLAVMMLLTLAACGGKSEAVLACEELIGSIGEVTLQSDAAISAAESAYAALEAKKQEQVEGASKLNESREKYEQLVKQAKADEVAALIDAIGEVGPDSDAAISAAEAAFAALSADEQMLLGDKGALLAELRATFDTVVQAQLDQEQAAAVSAAIDAIGSVTLESKSAIEAAKAQYNALSAEAKALVTNLAALEAAEAEYAAVVEEEKEKTIKQYEKNFEYDYDKVQSLGWYMHEDMPDYIDVRSYIIPYIGVQNNSAWICIRYNYTEDDWVFWESLTIVTDNEKYYKYVGPWDTVRDNDGGVVWEFYDECLNYNQSLDSEELLMLKDIAESNETIIRFQGDDYHYDLVVTKKDKKIISDVLALYGALIA